MAKAIEAHLFLQDVKEGKTKKEIAEKYELPMSTAAKFAKELGVKFKRTITPKYVLVHSTHGNAPGPDSELNIEQA